jgi:hypothetical protein
MTAPPNQHADEDIFWRVQSVFDPDGGGADFAYTIGLHTRDLPELHLWARPSLGADPGADWQFSNRDRVGVLNELAELLVEGRLDVGSELSREYDGGLATVSFRVDPPGDREELEALGVPPGVDVLPVRWSLHRPAEGPLRPLTEEADRAASGLFLRTVQSLELGGPALPGWELPTKRPAFDPDQRFGPLTPVVLARGAQLWQADDETIVALLRAAASTNVGYTLTYAVTRATAFARPVGRRKALEELRGATHGLVDALTVIAPASGRWRRISEAFDPGWWAELDGEGRRKLARDLAGLLHEVTVSCLMVDAVADVADESLLLEGRGPWEAGMSREPLPPGPEWEVSGAARTSVDNLLNSLDMAALRRVLQAHALAWTDSQGSSGYAEVCSRLQSWAMVSASVYPHQALADAPGWRPLRDQVPGVRLLPPKELQQWATCLASAFMYRERLLDDDVTTFVSPFVEDLPQLAGALDFRAAS